MNCQNLCGHNIKRFHASCLFCRHRRLFKAQLDPNKYCKVHMEYRFVEDPNGKLIINKNAGTGYVMTVDPDRNFAFVKDKMLKKVWEIAEFLAN